MAVDFSEICWDERQREEKDSDLYTSFKQQF